MMRFFHLIINILFTFYLKCLLFPRHYTDFIFDEIFCFIYKIILDFSYIGSGLL